MKIRYKNEPEKDNNNNSTLTFLLIMIKSANEARDKIKSNIKIGFYNKNKSLVKYRAYFIFDATTSAAKDLIKKNHIFVIY